MHHKSSLVAAPLIGTALCKTAGQLCQGTAARADDGNWYCSEVKAITYRNISQPGQYNRTTRVDADTGLCFHETVKYSGRGSLTPLFRELSMHLRGPMNVSQIAAYELSNSASSGKKRENLDGISEANVNGDYTERKLSPDTAISDGHRRLRTIEHPSPGVQQPRKRTEPLNEVLAVAACDCIGLTTSTAVSATSALNHASSTFQTFVSTRLSNIPTTQDCTCGSIPATSKFPSDVGQSPTSAPSIPQAGQTENTVVKEAVAEAGPWNRIAYYTSSAPAAATGFSFLANLGDERKSGTFDYSFGNSLGYVTKDGRSVASEGTPFDGSLKTSEVEIAAFTDKVCEEECDYFRPKSVAHHGWDGEDKAFFIEFQMDHYDNAGNDQGMLSDAPAWWFLNAAVPRILQYGNDRNNIPCSCWSTGCGEFDAFEVLGRGEERAKSTIHRQGNLEGGDSNYFKRPVGKTLKFAVVFHQLNITAAVLDDSFQFSQTLARTDIEKIIAYDTSSTSHSLFTIGN